ncbi:MAG TPA: protein kinase [Pyrinomonadaceae bacterium]|nr:protein kinase [Pyrinomonadaceae bacterium]
MCPADGAVLTKTGDTLVGQTLAGKYRIEERISEGGMGTVYRATHVLMEKTVAIKVLNPSLAADDKIVARFTREAKAASRISNPHALTVTDFGESENGIVFLVMEYLRGQTLKQVIRTEGPMPLARVVEITKQVCGALDAAHAEGVVHRDLKSDNIMLEEVAGGSDWAKVLDFGIAKIQEPVGQDPELTAPNLIIGTPQYMSPEQCSQASEIDARSDIYSLGVILYEMFVGHVPFTGESATTIMLKHLQEAAPSVLEERKDLPAEVGQVVARALSKLPEERQQSAGELAESLARAATGAVGALTGENARAGDSDTNRIVVTTTPLAGRNTATTEPANAEQDEATVVRARPRYVPEPEFIPPPPAARFNPWRVMIPAAVLLVALLGAFFAYQRSSGPSATNDNSQPLTTDPNAVPVMPGASPTGASESNITPGTVAATPATIPAQGTTTGAEGTTTTNPNQNASELPTPASDNKNQNGDSETGDDETEPQPSPTPTATPRRNPTPPVIKSPTPADKNPADDPPPPTPKPTAADPAPTVVPPADGDNL